MTALAGGDPFSAARAYFGWASLQLMLEGTSPLDMTSVGTETRAEAYAFLRTYGLNMEDARDREEVRQIHQESLDFIRRQFLVDTPLELPPEVVRPDDVADLLVMASLPNRPTRARWACAVLRVMQTVHHANRTFRNESYEEIRRQIFEPYRQCLQVDELGCPVLARDNHRVQLEGVFFKEDKSRDSIILKLLHKGHSQDIYDWIGIRFVTRTRAEALLVVRFLRMHTLVIFASIVPGRSINTLIDLKTFRKTFEELVARYQAEDDAHALWLLENMTHESRDFAHLAATARQNPFSGSEYRSIQFTCRQLVRVPNPSRRPIDTVYAFLRDHPDTEAAQSLIRQLDRVPVEKELTFFFPYEIQILDYENYLKTRMGQSSHAAYKKRQIHAARRRVMEGLL